MIFKTFDNDINRITNRLGIFNKTFQAIGRDLSNKQGLFTSLFSGNSVTQNDIQSIKAMEQAMKNGATTAQAWNAHMTGCTVAAKQQAKQCLMNKESLSTLTNSLEKTTVSAKAAEIGLKALSIAGNMLLMWGISEVIKLIGDCATASNRLKESAEELGSAFSSTKSDIDSYKTKIEELYKVIDSNSSSYEDTYNARQELLTIQNEMIEKFGDEAEAVGLVTQAINGQTQALGTLTKNQWEETVSSFNYNPDESWTKKVANTWANIWSGSSNNFERMQKEMENTDVEFTIPLSFTTDESSAKFISQLEDIYGDVIEISNINGNSGDYFGISVSGDLDDIYDKLLNIKSLAEDFGVDESFLSNLDKQIAKSKSKLDGYEEIYSQHVLYDKIFDNEEYEESFDKINDAYKKHQDIFATGDEEAIAEAKQNFAKVVQSATEGVGDNDKSVIDYFNNMYPDLKEVVGSWEFEVKFKAAVKDNGDNFENDVKNAIEEFNTAEEIKKYSSDTATDEQKTAYRELNELADKYNLTLDQLIDKLVQMGLISSQTKEDLLNKLIPSHNSSTGIGSVLANNAKNVDPDVATKWVESLTEEEAKLANSKEFEQALERQKEGLNGATLSADNYSAALQEVKDSQNQTDTDETDISFLGIMSEVQALSAGLDQIDKIYADVYDKEDFDWSSILNNEDFTKEFGNMQNVTDEYKDAYENFIKTVSNSPDDLNACQSAFDDLATAYIYNSGVLDKVTEETKDATIAFLQQKGVANAEEVVIASLTAKKEALALKEQALAITKNGVTDKTRDEINALLDEAGASETARNWLFKLIAEEQVFNSTELDVSGKIAKLKELASAYGQTAISARAAYILEQAEKSHTSVSAKDLEELTQDVTDLVNKPVVVDYQGGSATKSAKNTTSGSGSSGSGSDSSSKPSIETIDFIEIAIKRIENAIDKLKTKAENTFVGFTVRANHYSSLLSKITEEINLQSNAYAQYMAKANSTGLSEVYASQIRNGSLNIVDVADDNLKEQIKNYQTWYEKAQECQDKIEELKITQTELTQAKIELLITKYEKLAEKASNANDRIQNKIDIKESWGVYANATDYSNMNKNIMKQISYIKKQNEQLNQLMKTVEKGSESWLEYNLRLDSNKVSLQDLTKEISENATAVAELAKAKSERKVSKYDSSDEKLEAKIANSTSYSTQNKYLNSEMNNITKRQKAYDEAVKTDSKGIKSTSKAINKTKVTKANKSILKKIKNYVKKKKEIPISLLDKASKLGDNGALYNRCRRYNAYITAYEVDKETADLYKETSKQDKAELAQKKLDNIQTYYGNRQQEFNQRATRINAKIDLAEESGFLASKQYYAQLIAIEKQNNNSLIAERDRLTSSLAESLLNGSVVKYSDEWYDMCQQIDDVTNSIDQSTLSLKEFENTMRQIEWDNFDYLENKITNVVNEIDFMINELSRQDLTSDKTGGLTDEGNAVAYLRASKYETLGSQLADYYKELERLETTENQSDSNVIERQEELRQIIQDTTSAMEDEKYAIIDLYTDAYEALSSKIKDLISEYEDLLDAEKDAYNWQNTVADKTKEIANIRKQLSAYAGDNSEEAKAKIQQLNVSLGDAEKDLKDSQYDKYLSDTKDILSDLQDDMDKNIQDVINNLNENFTNLMNTINNSASTSAATVKETMTGIGYESSEEFAKLLSGTLVGLGIGKAVDETVGEVKKDVQDLQNNANNNATFATNTIKHESASQISVDKAVAEQEAKVAELKKKYDEVLSKYNAAKKTTSDLKTKMEDIGWMYGVDSKKYKNAKEKYVTSKNNRDAIKKEMEAVKKSYETANNKLASLKKYSVGSKYIDKDQLAWTQDGGQELVYRSSDGAVLTRLGEGDKIFTNEMSENLWKLSQVNPADFIDGLQPAKLPDITKNIQGGDVTIDLGGVTMNGVNDVEAFNKNLREAICQNGKTTKCLVEAVSSMQMGKGIGNARLYK